MTRINMARVILGGIVAAVVINISEFVLHSFVIVQQMEEAVAARNLPAVSGQAIAVFMVMGLALGIALVWTYAAIRPRFGPGVGTALCAGSLVWFLAYAYPSLGMWAMGMFPAGVTVISLVWGLAELLAGAVAGAWLYQEPGSPAARV